MTELVILQNEQAITTSLKVAEVFEKNHQHVMRDIRDLEKQISQSKIGRAEEKLFELSNYIDAQGKSRPMYLMNRDGFSLLAMGFTGKKALQFKLDYIQAFNKMEEKLIELLAERKSAEWLEVRNATKMTFKKMTEAIQQNVLPLMEREGASENGKKFVYKNYTTALQKTFGVSKGTRDTLPVSLLYELDKGQSMAAVVIKGLAAAGKTSKEIFSGTKEKITDYAQLSLINQRFLN